MPRTVSVNDASEEQLVVLLGLSRPEARAIVGARPIGTPGALRRAVPRLAGRALGLEIPKFDINRASEADLQRIAGVSPAVARRIVASRPYFLLFELRRQLTGDADAFERLSAFFAPPDLSYLDKLTGKEVRLTPDSSQLLVRFADREAEAAGDLARALGLRRLSRGRGRSAYQVFAVPQEESGTGALADIKRRPGVESVVPSFRDAVQASRFVDPQFCVVQFDTGVPEARQAEIVASIGLEIRERHRSRGLLTLRVPGGDTDPGALPAALARLNAAPEVSFAEPAYVGLNDLEHAAQRARRTPRSADGAVAREAEAGAALAEAAAGSATAVETVAGALPWNFPMVRAAEAWTIGKGSPKVILAVIDTGVEIDHPSLRDAVLPRQAMESWNFEDDSDPAPTDLDGHGTFVAGLLVGNGAGGVQGLCPGCRLLPIRVPIAGSSLSYARRRDAILCALDAVPPDCRLVINISWKTSGDIAMVRDAVRIAAERNAVVVCSAGNWPDGPDQPHYPSDYASTISVGAVGPDGRRAVYSFYGAAVDIAAPGGSGSEDAAENIVSAGLGGSIAVDFGTSFAAPHVAATAALVLSRSPGLPASEVRAIVERAARPVSDAGLGHGLLDIGVATQSAAPADPDPSGPDATPGQGAAGLAAVNSYSLAALISSFGLATITARLLIMRRPHARLADIRGTLGLTAAQYARIEAYPSPP
jgi:subtilisin family serine protease